MRDSLVPQDIAEKANKLEQDNYRLRNLSLEDRSNLISLPNGQMKPFKEVFGAEYRPELIFKPVEEYFVHPEKMLKDPKPGYEYVWKVYDTKNGIKGDASRVNSLHYRVRSGAYRIVDASEIKDDADLPMTIYEMVGDKTGGMVDAIIVKGLTLTEISPRCVEEEYTSREVLAAMRADKNAAARAMQASVAGMGVNPEMVIIKQDKG